MSQIEVKRKKLTDILRVQGVNALGYGSIPKLVMKDPRLTRDAKAIYAYFCSYAGAGDTAFPSLSQICEDLGFRKAETFIKHRKLLEKYGYLKVEQERAANGKFSRNIYVLLQFPVEQETNSGESSPIPVDWESATDSQSQGIRSKAIPLKRELNNNTNRSRKDNRSNIDNRSIESDSTTTTNLETNYYQDTKPRPKKVVVDNPSRQTQKPKCQLPTNDDINMIQSTAKAIGVSLSHKNAQELFALAEGDLEQISNGIQSAVQYAQYNRVKDMWSLIKQSVLEGKIPALVPHALMLEQEMQMKKKQKYQDVYMS